MKSIDLSGHRFGRLVAIEISGKNNSGGKTWRCICDCGEISLVNSDNLRRGVTKSCGCLKQERQRDANIKHGMYGSGAHQSWMSMRQRCLNSKNRAYKNYGGRGILICKEWDSFAVFHKDMGDRPVGFEIDRINPNGNYEPMNCRWSTPLEQSRNQRKTIWVEINGVRKNLSEWAEIYGISYKTVMTRIHGMGWCATKAITTPLMRLGTRFRNNARPE